MPCGLILLNVSTLLFSSANLVWFVLRNGPRLTCEMSSLPEPSFFSEALQWHLGFRAPCSRADCLTYTLGLAKAAPALSGINVLCTLQTISKRLLCEALQKV